MTRGTSTGMETPVPVGRILKRILGHDKQGIARWVLSTKASRQLEAVHIKTGIDKVQLADAAVAALHAALSGSANPVKIRDARLREWLHRQPDVEEA